MSIHPCKYLITVNCIYYNKRGYLGHFMDDLVLSGPQACKYCKEEGKNKTKKPPNNSNVALLRPFFA